MALSPTELRRLEKLENFVERLTLGSYLAKAADTGGKVGGQPLSAGDRNLARAATGTPDLTSAGEDILAKAVGAFNDPETLLAFADRNIDNPTTIGVVSGHLSNNDLPSARTTVLEYVQRGQIAKAAEVMQGAANALDDDLASFDSRRAVSEMTARFGMMERTISALEARLTQMERHPQNVPAPVVPPDQNTVAKASNAARRPQVTDGPPSTTTKVELLAQIHAYCDSATTVGQLSSMLEAGQVREVQAAVASAKRAHEAQKLVQERKSWS